MLHRLKLAIASVATMILFSAATAGVAIYTAPSVLAQPSFADSTGQACAGLNQLGGSGCGKGANGTVSHLMAVALNILSLIAGFIAVIMVILSGIKFMTANGDASQISSARQSLIYALAGIIIVAMAQILVHFVIGKTTKGIF